MRLKSHQDPDPDGCFSRVKELYRQNLRCGQADIPAGRKLAERLGVFTVPWVRQLRLLWQNITGRWPR